MKNKLKLTSVLALSRVPELKVLAETIDLRLSSRARKAELVEALNETILSRPEAMLALLPLYELELIKEILSTKSGFVPWPYPMYNDSIFAVLFDEVITTADDLLEVVAPIIDKVIADRLKSPEYPAEQHILGLLNLRGSIDALEIIRVCEKHNLVGYPTQKKLLARFRKFKFDSTHYGSPYALTEYMCEAVLDYDSVHKAPDFTLKEIRDAASMPRPRMACKYYDRLKKSLKKQCTHPDDEEIELMLNDMWLDQQRDDEHPLSKYMSLLKCDNETVLQNILQDLQNYLNNIPMWRFNGQTPNDMHRERPTKITTGNITLGPNLRALGFNDVNDVINSAYGRETGFNDLLMDIAGDQTIFSDGSRKPNRNDPCPCGSGRKYKNCCGRNIN